MATYTGVEFMLKLISWCTGPTDGHANFTKQPPPTSPPPPPPPDAPSPLPSGAELTAPPGRGKRVIRTGLLRCSLSSVKQQICPPPWMWFERTISGWGGGIAPTPVPNIHITFGNAFRKGWRISSAYTTSPSPTPITDEPKRVAYGSSGNPAAATGTFPYFLSPKLVGCQLLPPWVIIREPALCWHVKPREWLNINRGRGDAISAHITPHKSL